VRLEQLRGDRGQDEAGDEARGDASGSRTPRGSVEANRISEKIGASAAPKKAVFTWAAKDSPRNRA